MKILTSVLAIAALTSMASLPVLAQSKKDAKPSAVKSAATPQAPISAAPVATQNLTPPTFGPAIAGQCYVNQSDIIGTSAMGRAALKRLSEIESVVQSELKPEADALKVENDALVAAQKTTTAAQKAQFETKVRTFSEKIQKFEQKAQLRNRELELTRNEVMQGVFARSIPYINQSVTAKSCSSVMPVDNLLQYDSKVEKDGKQTQSTFVYLNSAMDITTDIITRMDASNERLPFFDRIEIKANQAAKPQTK